MLRRNVVLEEKVLFIIESIIITIVIPGLFKNTFYKYCSYHIQWRFGLITIRQNFI